MQGGETAISPDPARTLRRTGVVLAVLAALVLAGAVVLALGWRDRAPVEGWMTVHHVMRAYGLGEAELVSLLGPEAMRPGRTLDRIAEETGRDAAALVASVEAAALAHRETGG